MCGGHGAQAEARIGILGSSAIEIRIELGVEPCAALPSSATIWGAQAIGGGAGELDLQHEAGALGSSVEQGLAAASLPLGLQLERRWHPDPAAAVLPRRRSGARPPQALRWAPKSLAAPALLDGSKHPHHPLI
jgi:hypothetical protein